MSEYYDDLETRSADARAHALAGELSRQIANARSNTRHYASLLGEVDAQAIDSRDRLASLPLTRKSDLLTLQAGNPPFGGLAAVEVAACARVFTSPGPLFEPETARADYWRFARAMFAAGFRAGDLVHNTFSYHMTPAGSMMESGARAVGCPVFPAGVGQTEQQVQAIAALKPVGYAGTPSFLNLLYEKAEEMSINLASLRKGLVGGEAYPPSLREALAARGMTAYQCFATADVGLIAYESPALEGLIVDEGVVVEIVRPGTGDPVPDGEVGELIVTTLNPDYPLIRFATGDLSAVMSGTSACGRTNQRIKGWLGRADQSTKVRGMFVRPEQIAALLARFAEVKRARLVVSNEDHRDQAVLRCETDVASDDLAARISAAVPDICKVRAEVELVTAGSLPNDGKVIDDVRTYD